MRSRQKDTVGWRGGSGDSAEQSARDLADNTTAGAGYSDWTKDDLSSELESRGLAKTGNKDELIARLEEHDAG